MRRSAARLADGREIVYFDHDGAPPRTGFTDHRELPPRPTAAELRHDPLLDEWVAIAAHRQTRTHLPAAADCPLCPSRPGHPTEIPAPGYHVAVFENRFPALAGPGRCEVVCFTDQHDASFADLTVPRARLVIDALADRTAVLAALPGVEQVYCFENRGEEIGVTLHHPHGQLYAFPFVTPRTRQLLATTHAHATPTGPGRAAGTGAAGAGAAVPAAGAAAPAGAGPGGVDLLGAVLAAERAGPRVVVAGVRWTVFVPAAARWPVEVHVVPHRFVPDLPALSDAERDELAEVYLDVLRRLDRLYAAPLPYVAAWHQAPTRHPVRLHLQVFSPRRAAGRLKYLAGTEAGMGVFSNDVLPEDTARRLRATS